MGETRRPQLDAGRALQQMELVAWSEGLGTCFVGIRGEQQDQVKTLLGIPEDMELITVLPFGYRVMRPAGTGTPRKPMSEITHGERFGQALTFAVSLPLPRGPVEKQDLYGNIMGEFRMAVFTILLGFRVGES